MNEWNEMKLAFSGKISSLSQADARRLFSRGASSKDATAEIVMEIIENVEKRGDSAILEYCERFDGAKMKVGELEVSGREIKEAYGKVAKKTVAALRKSAENIRKFAELEKEKNWFAELKGGRIGGKAAKPPSKSGFVGKIVLPLESAGVYAPGGRAAYPSSVLMGVIPGKVAGVGEVIVCSPPDRSGKLNPLILVAADLAGADKVFKIGGAQAIAAMAFGTKTVPRVGKIVGPGNVFVNAAKKLVAAKGIVAIDLPAGPSEVLVVADETAKPEWVAADLLAQAEHDENACAVVVALDREIAEKVERELEIQLEKLQRKTIAKKSLERNGAILLARGLEEAVEFANDYAPEHLELCVEKPVEKLKLVKNAGAVFLGNWSCEAVGDYAAGPNHVLPTGGTARAWPGLSVKEFVKETSVEFFSEKDLQKLGKVTEIIARAEGLGGHAQAVARRMKNRISRE